MQKFYIGKIVKPQGVKGELKLATSIDNNDMLKNITTVFVGENGEECEVVKIVYRLGFIYLTIKNCTDRNMAELYRNKKVYAQKQQIQTKQNEFLVEDLIGLDVYDENGDYVGQILDFENYGANDIIYILEDKREYSVAFLKEIFVDISTAKVVVSRRKYDEAKLCE
ncbi:MAG: 16S rRNA processing protein RimM [Clostridia bacterium]|nr:16S rRNA processing protein RimM [Clostridia bacterium]